MCIMSDFLDVIGPLHMIIILLSIIMLLSNNPACADHTNTHNSTHIHTCTHICPKYFVSQNVWHCWLI